MKLRLKLLLSLFIVFGLSSVILADDLGLDFTGGFTGSPVANQTLGWEFSLSTTQTVTSLGIFDIGSNGLNSPHLVGIWSSGGTLLGSVTVNSASSPVASTSTAGNWLFEALGLPIVLNPGNYILGVDYADPADQVMTGTDSVAMASGLTFVQGRFVNSPTAGFDFPDATFGGSFGHFGPNLLLSVAVPEPTTWALIGVIAVGTGAYSWKKRRQGIKNLFAKVK